MWEIVSLPDNYGINPFWSDWSLYTDTSAPGLLSFYLLMEKNFLPFILCFLILYISNMHDAQRGTSPYKYRNLDGRNPIFILKTYILDVGERTCYSRVWTPVLKVVALLEMGCSQFFLVWYYFIYLYSPLRELELIKYLSHYLAWGTP